MVCGFGVRNFYPSGSGGSYPDKSSTDCRTKMDLTYGVRVLYGNILTGPIVLIVKVSRLSKGSRTLIKDPSLFNKNYF